MSTNFLNNLNGIFGATTANYTTIECEDSIDHFTYYQTAIIPAAVITLIFAMAKKRRNVLKGFWHGRPGLIFPMDSLTRSSRLPYACAFGATAFLIYQIVLHRSYAIDVSSQPSAVKSFVALLSMFMYGIVFFPLFATLALGSVVGYTMGSLYVWMLTSVEIYRLTQCSTTTRVRLLLVFRGLPSLLCLVYLSGLFPWRVVHAFRQKRYFFWQDDTLITNTMEDIRTSYSGLHVIKLLGKPKPKRPVGTTLKARIYHLALLVFHKVVYKPKKGFLYPARIFSITFVAILVVYTLTFEILSLFPPMMGDLQDGILSYLDSTIGRYQLANDSDTTISIRQGLDAAYWFVGVTQVCCIVADVVAALITVLNVLHILSSYRANVFALYRGDYSHIPPASEYGYTTNCVNSIKYAGYQVGYIIWGYLLLFVVLTLISVVCAIIITLITYEFTDWVVQLINILWPIILTAALVAISQILLAKYVFLQDRGQSQALNNRNLYFNFTYFMFFYNIFLGLVSCLLRVLKAMLVGIVFLSRLDNSTLPRKFEFIDPGFKAYVGYMHIEASHTHPVAIVFCRLMLLGLQEKKEREEAGQKAAVVPGAQDVKINMKGAGGSTMSEVEWRRHLAARTNWQTLYTLLNNPSIRLMRKGYLQLLRQAKEYGLYIPVSDTQADLDLELLQQKLAEVKAGVEKYEAVSGDGDEVKAKDDGEKKAPQGKTLGNTSSLPNGMRKKDKSSDKQITPVDS